MFYNVVHIADVILIVNNAANMHIGESEARGPQENTLSARYQLLR